MTQINTKRVYDADSPEDGFRILVDKLWPRGIKKENLKYDLWEKDIEPSKELRQWFHEDPTARWEEFQQKYLHELRQSSALNGFVKVIAQHDVVTLLYAAKDKTHNQVVVLKPFLEKLLRTNSF